MKKRNRILTLAGLFCLGAAHIAQGQANDWIIPPDKHMHFTSCCNFLSTLPSTSTIASCGAGPTYAFSQYAGVVSDSTGAGLAFVNACGIYNPNTGVNIGSNSSPYAFAIPGLCNTYYSVDWNAVGFGTSRHQELYFHRLDASNASAVTETGVTTILPTADVHAIAAAPLAADGSRKVYLTDNQFRIVSVNVASNGVVGSPVVLATLPTRVWSMEVSPNGKSIVMSHRNYVTLYDLATNTETVLGGSFPSTTVIAGMEYVPNTNSGDRVYISYHQMASASSFLMEGLGYVNLSAPTVLNDALTGMPGTIAKSGFGFTEIERGKNGYLYFAYHPGYTSHLVLNGSTGPMYSTYPDVPSYFVTVSPATSVSAIDQGSSFIIQVQIDGEDYRGYALNTPTFTVNGKSQTPTAIPTILLCDDDSIRMYTNESGYYSSYEVTIQKGTVFGNYIDYGSNPVISSGVLPGSRMRDTLNLQNIFGSNLDALYSGGVTITYKVYNGCGSQFSTQTVILKRAATVASYQANKTASNNGITGKGLQKTLPITTPMPTGATPTGPTMNQLLDDLGNTIGWQGASSAGICNLNANGTYALKVYEVERKPIMNSAGILVDSTVRRTVGTDVAPDIFSVSGTGIASGQFLFNSRTLKFAKPGTTNANSNFLYNTTFNNQSSGDYFKKYYGYAEDEGLLSEFNQKTWCVDFTVTTVEGCVARNLSYFRIVTSTTLDAVYARMASTGVAAGSANEIRVSPNPASDNIRIQFATRPKSASVALYDIYGRIVRSQTAVSAMETNLDIKSLPAGTYTYKVNADGKEYNGKIVKQ
jgi:hypothetical protein